MSTIFAVIADDFIEDLNAIRSLVTAIDIRQPVKTRIAAANSATLLVAATFEQFVREMAREYARAVVLGSSSFSSVPREIASTAWKRTLGKLSRIKIDTRHRQTVELLGSANASFSKVLEFCKGDITQDIYDDLIYNETNMKPNQINTLFKVSGLSDVCLCCADKQPLLTVLGQTESTRAYGLLLSAMENFFERRNNIAHALNAGSSSSPNEIAADIQLFESFARALQETLIGLAPAAP